MPEVIAEQEVRFEIRELLEEDGEVVTGPETDEEVIAGDDLEPLPPADQIARQAQNLDQNQR